MRSPSAALRPRPSRLPLAAALAGAAVALSACAPSQHRAGAARAPSPEVAGPSGAPREALPWATLGDDVFVRARREGRLVVIDGSAEWCHWCHVMEASTYHDPEVRQILDARFVAVKVDVDSRPDFEERYAAWGWPATVLMDANGTELGKYKGYIPPARFAEVLREAQAAHADGAAVEDAGDGHALTASERAEARGRIEKQLASYWDPREGSWGVPQKVPLSWDNAWSLERARRGDAGAQTRVLFALDRQRGIVDPVWGGVCQYSTDGDWKHPHHEKLMTVQAGAIANYAEAFTLTRDEGWLRTARQVRGFVDRFMTGPDGAFLTTMDADLNAHEPPGSGKTYVPGDAYYAMDDAARRALGVPRIDAHAYGRENGLAIDAYATLYDATGDRTALEAARKAATAVLATHATPGGGITHGAAPEDDGSVLYLADDAAFGFGLAHLARATGDGAWLAAAQRIAEFLLRDLQDAEHGGFWASTPDPHAVGVFAARRKPFEHDVMAVRFLARLNALSPDPRLRAAIDRALPHLLAAPAVDERGRFLGDLLLALDETD